LFVGIGSVFLGFVVSFGGEERDDGDLFHFEFDGEVLLVFVGLWICGIGNVVVVGGGCGVGIGVGVLVFVSGLGLFEAQHEDAEFGGGF